MIAQNSTCGSPFFTKVKANIHPSGPAAAFLLTQRVKKRSASLILSLVMASIVQFHSMLVPDNLGKQLAVAVRSIQWSYAIFWSLSTSQQGLLEWSDGYYNGDIKTRKVQAMELKADKLGLQRSEQLRELYNSLLGGNSADQQANRPSPTLSPEDLSDEEWYYLVCMSFVFNPGEGLPGKALANNQTIWLCNAQHADSKVFSRSLLAKSASIQTVVCFPYLEGVMELGVTELVAEDLTLIQHIKASLLNFSKPVCSEKSSSAAHNTDDDRDQMSAKISHQIDDTLSLENIHTPTEEGEIEPEGIKEVNGDMREEYKGSPADCTSNGCEHNHQAEDSFMLEGLNGGSQVQSWHFMDDEFSNGVRDSMNSSDCVSEAFADQEKVVSSFKGKNISHLKELREGNCTKFGSLDLAPDDDLHYKKTLYVILRSSSQLIANSCFGIGDKKSSFVSWKKGTVGSYKPRIHQNMLKKILFAVPFMYDGRSLRSGKENGGRNSLDKLEERETCKWHFKSDKQKENEKFLLLRAMVPSISEIDKSSILSDTIEYLKQLESRVAELESCMNSVDYEPRPRRNFLDMVDRTSDNHENKKIDNDKKPWINKRKACDIDEVEPELTGDVPNDGMTLDVMVSMKEKEVLVEMKCPYREYMLLDLMDETNKLQLDVYSIQSSTLDGILTLALKSKFRGEAAAQERMIKQALWKVASKA